MKIYCLVENTTDCDGFLIEHGLSLYLETNNHKILFDFGQSDCFIENAQKLGINLQDVDIAILSHGHYDHGGGLLEFLEINQQAKVYVNNNAFNQYYNGTNKYIGLNQEIINNKRLIKTGDYLKIDDELELCTCNQNPCIKSIDSAGLMIKEDSFSLDTFRHEQYLIINESKKVVISGCSHKGIINIVNWLKPDVLIGGFHYKKQLIIDNQNPVLDQASKELRKHDCLYYTCHCTGIEQYLYLKKTMKGQLSYLACGDIVEI